MAGYYLVIKDAEYAGARTEMAAYGHQLEGALEEYQTVLNAVTNGAISSGSVHDALVLFNEYVTKARIIAGGLGDKFERLVSDFQHEVDNVDDYLYVEDLNPVRDFSDKEFEHLKRCLDTSPFKLYDRLDDFATGLFVKVADFFHWEWAQKGFQNCSSLLLDYNNETLEGLTAIFEGVHGTDGTFQLRLEPILETYRDLHAALEAMAELISPKSGALSVKRIEAVLGGLFSKMTEDYLKAIAVPDSKIIPTIPQISDFASQPWADSYFFGFRICEGTFVTDLGGWDAAKLVLFQMFDIGETTLFEGNYNAYLQKKELMALLMMLMGDEAKLYEGTTKEDVVDGYRSFLKWSKKSGKSLYEYLNTHRGKDGKLLLDGRTRKARQFRGALEGLDNAGDIMEYGEQGIEFLSGILADYSAGLEVLHSLKENFSGDESMQNSIDEIERLYTKKVDAWLEEASKTIRKDGWDMAMKELGKETPVLAVVEAIDKGIDIVGKVTGLGPEAQSMYRALTLYNMNSGVDRAYASAVEKLRAADPNSEDYNALATDVRNLFELNKKNTVEMLQAMADASTGTKRSYYLYLRKEADKMSMLDTEKPNPMSFEQFEKVYG